MTLCSVRSQLRHVAKCARQNASIVRVRIMVRVRVSVSATVTLMVLNFLEI